MAVLLVMLLGIATTTAGLFSANSARRLAEAEVRRAEVEAERAREAEETAVKAEAKTQTTLVKSNRLAEELAVSLDKLSENASRMATQRAYTAIEHGRPQDGLQWLVRALELAPADKEQLEMDIRTALSVVAEELPQPRFVVAPDEEQVFAHAAMNRDGSRILLLVAADPPAAPKPWRYAFWTLSPARRWPRSMCRRRRTGRSLEMTAGRSSRPTAKRCCSGREGAASGWGSLTTSVGFPAPDAPARGSGTYAGRTP